MSKPQPPGLDPGSSWAWVHWGSRPVGLVWQSFVWRGKKREKKPSQTLALVLGLASLTWSLSKPEPEPGPSSGHTLSSAGSVQIWVQSGWSLNCLVRWSRVKNPNLIGVRFGLGSDSVLVCSSQDLSPIWDCSIDTSSSDRPVSMAMTNDATEALLAICWNSPVKGKEGGRS